MNTTTLINERRFGNIVMRIYMVRDARGLITYALTDSRFGGCQRNASLAKIAACVVAAKRYATAMGRI